MTSQCSAYVVCFDKRTGKPFNDFQSLVKKDGTLTGNAVRAGKGNPEDFEEREVTREEFYRLGEQVNGPKRKREKEEMEKKKEQLRKKLRDMGFNVDEAEIVIKGGRP